MIKLIMPMKRKPGLSVEEFREYYESHHRLIGEKYLSGYASRYMRRYPQPTAGRDGNIHDPEYDVFLEVWYKDEAAMQACGKVMREKEAAAEILSDEENLFDTRYMQSYVVVDCESELPDIDPQNNGD